MKFTPEHEALRQTWKTLIDREVNPRVDEWEKEVRSYGEFFDSLGPAMPRALKLHQELLLTRIEAVKGGHG